MSLVDLSREYLVARKGGWKRIALETGLGYEWMVKHAKGAIGDPGTLKLEKLLKHAKATGWKPTKTQKTKAA